MAQTLGRPESPRSFGAFLRDLREKTGLKQNALAKAVGVSPSYVSYLEKGNKVPGRRTLVKLARALGVAAEELIAVAEPENYQPKDVEKEPIVIAPVVSHPQVASGSLPERPWPQTVGVPAALVPGRENHRLAVFAMPDASLEPRVPEGAFVCVDLDSQGPLLPGKVFVFRTDGDLLVRQVDPDADPDSLQLTGLNKHYPPVRVPRRAPQVLGRVILVVDAL